MKDGLSHSAQDYLETILLLSMEEGSARVKDVAQRLKVSKPSVVSAIKALAEKGLVSQEPYGQPVLTEKGMEIAKEIYRKHRIIFKFLNGFLGVDPEIAEEDACKIEHYVSHQTLERLLKMIQFVESFPEPHIEPKWLTFFKRFVETGEGPPCPTLHGTGGKEMSKTTLDEIEVGGKARVKSITGDPNLRKRLLSMGIVPGTELTIAKVAPLGDPIDIKVRGYHLSLRKEEAKLILVEEV